MYLLTVPYFYLCCSVAAMINGFSSNSNVAWVNPQRTPISQWLEWLICWTGWQFPVRERHFSSDLCCSWHGNYKHDDILEFNLHCDTCLYHLLKYRSAIKEQVHSGCRACWLPVLKPLLLGWCCNTLRRVRKRHWASWRHCCHTNTVDMALRAQM